jgi:hypothetical protein
MSQLERCSRWRMTLHCLTGTQEIRRCCTHITTQHFIPHPQKLTPRENTKVRLRSSGLKFLIKEVCITAQIGIFTRLLYSQQKYHKHAKLKSLTTHCQPACHTDNLPDNLKIIGLRRFSRFLTTGVS